MTKWCATMTPDGHRSGKYFSGRGSKSRRVATSLQVVMRTIARKTNRLAMKPSSAAAGDTMARYRGIRWHGSLCQGKAEHPARDISTT
jgi:hypothetical protein